jgi:hypothetical protein
MLQIKKRMLWSGRWASLALWAFLAGMLLLIGCTSLCNKRLLLFRETPQKLVPTSGQALLITDPELANALLGTPKRYPGEGCQWAPEQLAHETDAFRLSIPGLDGKVTYQGLCMDTAPTYACEVRPGPRQVQLRLDMFGPWGRESVTEVARLNLEPGGCYFLRPDCEALKSRRLLLKVDRLPEPYTAELRARVIDWSRRNTKDRTIAD